MPSRNPLMPWLRLLAAVLLLAGAQAGRAAEDFLESEQAFKVSARALDDKTVEVSFTVAPGYYLYREQFKFVANGATLGTPALPHGKVKFDETFAKNVETYRDVLRVVVPVEQAGAEFRFIATSQGCADAGLCYPPMQSGFTVSLNGFGGDGSVRTLSTSELPVPGMGGSSNQASAASIDAPRDASPLGSALREGRFWPVVGAFFLAGVLLSLTPCVLPMLPIVSSIIAGHGEIVSRGRGLALAAAYSFGMALVYTALGVAAGLAGEGLAAALQTPWVLGAFALGLVALALSMFGGYEMRLPSAFTTRMARASQRLPAGRIAGVCAMGGVSALIVSPCVAAPLAGALVYLSQTRDVWLGGTALFSLAAGMSVPLLLVGASAGALLPRVGPWMNEVKSFFGLLLLGVALWTVQTVLPAGLVLALWGALSVGGAVLLISPGRGHRAQPARRLWRRVGAAVLGACGLLQLVGAASGGTDPLQPLGHLTAGARGDKTPGMPRFTVVRSVDELDAALRSAGRPVMLDFYADWCVSCKEMERFTFSDPTVQAKLEGALLLKADVTQNNLEDRALLKRFGLFGPPGTIFFDPRGREVADARVVGFQATDRFLETLRAAGL
jgi:thiol:disulfide interchange protein DsbD